MMPKTKILQQINHSTNTGALSTHYLVSKYGNKLFCSRAVWIAHCGVRHFKAGVNFMARSQAVPASLKINDY